MSIPASSLVYLSLTRLSGRLTRGGPVRLGRPPRLPFFFFFFVFDAKKKRKNFFGGGVFYFYYIQYIYMYTKCFMSGKKKSDQKSFKKNFHIYPPIMQRFPPPPPPHSPSPPFKPNNFFSFLSIFPLQKKREREKEGGRVCWGRDLFLKIKNKNKK